MGLKSDSRVPPKVAFLCFNKVYLEMMNNVFCFISRALFVLKILKFSPDIFGHKGKFQSLWYHKLGNKQ